MSYFPLLSIPSTRLDWGHIMARMVLHPQSFLSLDSSSFHELKQKIPHVQRWYLASGKTIYGHTTQWSHWDLVVNVGASVFVILLSYVALQHLVRCVTRCEAGTCRAFVHFYEDEDGEATAEPIQKASKSSPRLLILLCAATGTAVAVIRAAQDTVHSPSPRYYTKWVEMVIWVRYKDENRLFVMFLEAQKINRCIIDRYFFCFNLSLSVSHHHLPGRSPSGGEPG